MVTPADPYTEKGAKKLKCFSSLCRLENPTRMGFVIALMTAEGNFLA